MNRTTLALRTTLLAVALAIPAQGARTITGYVERIPDGDTLWIQTVPPPSPLMENTSWGTAATRYKIRMLGMDTPETVFPTGDGGIVGQHPWGHQASAYLKHLVKVGDRVSVESHGLDKYNRTLGFVFKNGQDLSLAMARAGWGVPYALCSGCREGFYNAHRVAHYRAACIAARNENRGVFNRANPLREMPFEFRARMSGTSIEKYVGDLTTRKLYDPRNYKRVDVCERIFFMTAADGHRLGYRP